jgi:hypothetical protein
MFTWGAHCLTTAGDEPRPQTVELMRRIDSIVPNPSVLTLGPIVPPAWSLA